MGKRSELNLTQRMEAVLALVRREEAAVRIARRFGISERRCTATAISSFEAARRGWPTANEASATLTPAI